ncbi:MAG: hypothetical protein LBI64_07435 [Coriobacteriales bacterium]|jgi:hypothetical protein|nr:hypothetical protein [Coriobacteriales bacterium]
MGLKHKVTINVATPGGIRDPVLKSGRLCLRNKLLNVLFGEKVGLIVVTPAIRSRRSKFGRSGKEKSEHEQN